jgi:hypothetical protein
MTDDRTRWDKFVRLMDDFWLRFLNTKAHYMQTSYDWEWDRYVETALNLGMVRILHHGERFPNTTLAQALRKDLLENYSLYTCMVGPHEVWIGNYPYSFGSPYEEGSVTANRMRPRMRVLRQLKKELDRQFDAVRQAERNRFFEGERS